MAFPVPSSFLLLFVCSFLQATLSQSTQQTLPPSPYLSPSLFFLNYQKMIQTFKIFVYKTNHQPIFNTITESLFHTSLLESPFITTNPNEAHLFYLNFPPNSSYKTISRQIKDLQTDFPFWNRTLGADHFYVSCNGISYESDRNLVELKKNSIQISCFPSTVSGSQFIPHKDITLPLKHFDQNLDYSGKLCVFSKDSDDVSGVGEALKNGCVPVVVSEESVRDMPFMDVLKWSEIAMFVEGRGVEEVRKKMVVDGACGAGPGEKFEKMREMGKKASQHFVWNDETVGMKPQPYDAFHTVLYQLWVRRHTIRYARRIGDVDII